LDIGRCGALALVSMNCEQLAQATNTSPPSLREQEPSKSRGLLLLGTSWDSALSTAAGACSAR
jgi:hypothetical protein